MEVFAAKVRQHFIAAQMRPYQQADALVAFGSEY
jgi:hypothetical protein